MRKFILLLTIFLSLNISAQYSFKDLSKVSRPVKIWGLFHLFKVKRATKIAAEANKVSDSIGKTNILDRDGAGGQVDAFRHAYWLARMRQEIGKSAARSLGKAYEKENYLTYKKNKLEDGVVPDEISTIMDLHNNEEGLKLIKRRSRITKESLINTIVEVIKKGEMKIIKKDKNGNFLTCDGELISKESLKGKWVNNKCLVASDQKYQ